MAHIAHIEHADVHYRRPIRIANGDPFSRRLAVATWIGASAVLWAGVIVLASTAVRLL